MRYEEGDGGFCAKCQNPIEFIGGSWHHQDEEAIVGLSLYEPHKITPECQCQGAE